MKLKFDICRQDGKPFYRVTEVEIYKNEVVEIKSRQMYETKTAAVLHAMVEIEQADGMQGVNDATNAARMTLRMIGSPSAY